jgi:DNA-binding transcriptional MerR regulator
MRSGDGVSLGIGEVAERTGLSEPVLRTWETRFGYPSPRRSPSGRRRYSEQDVDALRRVVRERAAGLSLEAAIDRAFASPAHGGPSIFSGLRERHPHVPSHRIPSGP